MRKLLFFAVVFGSLFLLFVSVGAKKANAQILGDGAIVSGYLDNTAGTIPITVTISFYSGSAGSPVLLPAPNPKVYVVPVGQRVSASYTDTIDRGWYQISWGTSCTDPPVSTSNAVVPGAYIFASQDVHCTTPNATPSITNTACANFGWNLTGVGSNGSNISSFEVFMSTNFSQVGPGDPTIGPAATLGLSARSYDFGALGSGTYYVRVRAVSPQGIGSWSSVDQFTCAPAGMAPVAASNLNATRSCNGSGAGNIVNVAFTWNRSTPMPSDEQWIDYSVYNNGFGDGFANASLSTSASSYNGTGFAQGIKYYWRINNLYGTNWYPSVTGSFVTPTCPVGASPRPTPSPLPSPPSGDVQLTAYIDCSIRNNAGVAVGGVRLNWSVNSPNVIISQGTTYSIIFGRPGAFYPGSPPYGIDSYEIIPNTTIRTFTIPFGTNTLSGAVNPLGFPMVYNNAIGVTKTWQMNIGFAGPYFLFSNSVTLVNSSCAPAITYTITASGNSDCVDGTNAKVHLTWTSNTDSTTYTIYKDGVAQSPTVGGAGRSWDSGPEIAGQLHSWVVRGTGGVAGTINSNAVAITTATCSSPPVNASGLIIGLSCNGANPEVTFTWADNATNETGYWLDVSYDDFKGPTTTSRTPSEWGVKTLGANVTSWLWSSNVVAGVSGPMDAGNANSQTATDTDDLKPLKSTQYYWRIRAFNADRQSDHVYPPFGTVPPGTPFETLNCGAVDLQVRFDDTTWEGSAGPVDPLIMRFQPSDTVKVNVLVTNAATSPLDSPATDLDIYYLGSGGTPDCPTTSVVTAPGDAIGAPQRYPVPLILKGDTATISVTFKIGTGGGTVYAFAAPKCNFSPASWTTMSASKSYLVKVVGFFETQGGDVGAAVGQSISVGFDSHAIPLYQSDYVIAAGTVDSKVHSKNGWMLNNYDKRQVSLAGIYDFFANKFKDKAVDNGCSFSHADAIQSCSGNLTFNPADTAPSGNKVFFVERDLNIMKNLELNAASSIVFIVKGDITIDTSVNRIDGIYIARHSFIDHNTVNPSLAAVTDALTVNGAVYVDTLDDGHGSGLVDLKRYFLNGPDNSTNAPVKIVYDPKYLISMRDIIGVKSIIWKEVAP